MIIVEDVHKRYLTDHGPGRWVLQGVSFAIPPKLNVALIGGNGAGKSTLLRLIGGVDMPSRGRIERQCRVSWPMGFGGGLQGSLTGRQNAKFVCRIHGHQDDIPERIAYIQEFAELGEAFDEPVKTYSSGMKARLQFGLSLAFDFDVYISDEVTAVGDAAFRDKAAASFKKLADRAGLIMVAHSEGTLRQFCSAGIWLNEGRAHWFDDLNDALKEYKKSQLNDQIASLRSRQTTGNQEEIALELEKLQQQRDALEIIEKGMTGEPATVGHELGQQVIQLARQFGKELVGIGQIATLGYWLKRDATPVLKKYYPAPHEKHLDLYELHSQCVKMEMTQEYRDALQMLEKGMNGEPATVDHEEGQRVIQVAKKEGKELVGIGQIATLGYWLNRDATPVLKKYYPAPHEKHLDLYELHSQCVKMETTQEYRDALKMLDKGMSGEPATVDHEEGLRVIQVAKKEGKELVGRWQIVKLGYRLKEGATPVLKKYYPAPHEKHLDLYELHSQCVEMESPK